MEPKKRRRRALVIAILCLLLLALLLPFRSCQTQSPIKTDPDLLSILLELRTELEWPGIDVETAAANLKTPEAVIEFVREETIYLPYQGAFAGPEAVLRTRATNSVDRARLTQALLNELGYKTRFMQLTPSAGKPGIPFAGSLERKTPPALQKLADYLGYDLNNGEEEIEFLTEAFAEVAKALEAESSEALQKIREIAPDFLAAAPPKAKRTHETVWNWTEYYCPEKESWIKADVTFENDRTQHHVREIPTPTSDTQISITGVRGDGSRVNLMSWSGDPVGHDAEVLFLPADRKPQELLQIREPNEIWAWMPVIQLGGETIRGKPFTPEGAVLSRFDGSPIPYFDETGDLSGYAPEVSDLSVTQAKCEDGKRVRIHLAASTMESPRWHSGHFSVKDNGEPVRQLRLESAGSRGKPVILVIDASGSMTEDGREKMARDAVNRLIDQLPDHQKLGLITHSYGSVNVRQELKPKGEGNAKEAFRSVVFWSAERILSAAEAALKMAEKPSTILFLTDGKDMEASKPEYAERLTKVLGSLKNSQSRLIPVGIGEADEKLMNQLAEASGTEYLKVEDPGDLPSLYEQLGSELSGSIQLSYAIPGEPEVGTKRNVSVEMDGYEGTASSEYEVKDGTPFGLVRIEMQVSGNQNITSRRTLVDFSDGYDGWNMMTKASLWLSPSVYPRHIVESRLVDEWIEALVMAGYLNGDKLQAGLLNRSFSHRQAATLNRIRSYQEAISPESPLPPGPCLWMTKESLHLEGETIMKRTDLDWLASFDWPAAENREQLARSFLSLLSAEGAVWTDESTNAKLLDTAGNWKVITSEDSIPQTLSRSLDHLPGHAEKQILITNPNAPDVGWKIDTTTGAIYGYLHEGNRISKGATLKETADEFGEIRSLLQLYSYFGGSALSAAALPSGAVFSAICSFFDQVVRMYCYSTLMMQQVGDAIEGGGENFDPVEARKTAENLCETSGDADGLARNLLSESMYGFARGTAENVVAGEITSRYSKARKFRPGSAADASVAATASGGVAAADPTPGTLQEVKKTMERNGLPTSLSLPSLQQAVEEAIFPKK